MTVYETATHQMTVEFKLLQDPLWPLTMNRSSYHNAVKGPKIQNVKLFIKHDSRPDLMQTLCTYSNK